MNKVCIKPSGVLGQGPPLKTYQRKSTIKREIIKSGLENTMVGKNVVDIKKEVIVETDSGDASIFDGSTYIKIRKEFLDNVKLNTEIDLKPEVIELQVEECDQYGIKETKGTSDYKGIKYDKELETPSPTKKRSNPDRYTCHICKRKFRIPSDLKEHLWLHTGDRPYQCDICNSTFRQFKCYDRHLKVHAGMKNYVCQYCNKAFGSSGHRNVHMRIHTNERPYPCEICEKKFKTLSSYNEHLVVHTWERPFDCQFCDKKFKCRRAWKAHRTVHTGDRPFICDVCYKGFRTKGYLKVHIMSEICKRFK